MRKILYTSVALALALGAAAPAAAYVGPGPGLSLLGALWGLLVSVGTAIAFIVLWPVRRARRRRAARRAREQATRDRARHEPGGAGVPGTR